MLEFVFILACLLIKVMCCLTSKSSVNWCPNCLTHDILSLRSARCECPQVFPITSQQQIFPSHILYRNYRSEGAAAEIVVALPLLFLCFNLISHPSTKFWASAVNNHWLMFRTGCRHCNDVTHFLPDLWLY